MKIEVLYSEVCNLSGDFQNVEYLRQSLPEADFIFTSLTDAPYFAENRPDMVLMGTMTEAIQRRVIETLRPYRDRLEKLIDDGVVFLMTGNACEVFVKHIDYVTEKLSVICVVILRERGKFFCLSDIMEHSRSQKKISVQHRILLAEIIAHFDDADRMLQKTADKAVMNALGCRMKAELLHKIGVIYKKSGCKLS